MPCRVIMIFYKSMQQAGFQKYFSLNRGYFCCSSFKQLMQRQSSYLACIKADSSTDNWIALHWHCAMVPTLHSNGLLQRGQRFSSCLHIVNDYQLKLTPPFIKKGMALYPRRSKNFLLPIFCASIKNLKCSFNLYSAYAFSRK